MERVSAFDFINCIIQQFCRDTGIRSLSLSHLSYDKDLFPISLAHRQECYA